MPRLNEGQASLPPISKSRTAGRLAGRLSRPFLNAVRDGIIHPDDTILDYGCGTGFDVELLRSRGYDAMGWDPASRETASLSPADVVNLGYVLNVLPTVKEREAVLRSAFSLARKVLIVSAYMRNGKATEVKDARELGDGRISASGGFQKLFYQSELRSELGRILPVNPIKADFGCFYVPKEAQNFLMKRDDLSWIGEGVQALKILVSASSNGFPGRVLKRELDLQQLKTLREVGTSFPQLVQSALKSTEGLLNSYRSELRKVDGKQTRDAVYVHKTAVKFLPLSVLFAIVSAYRRLPRQPWEVVKLSKVAPTIHFIDCESFEEVAHPAIHSSATVNLETGIVGYWRESSDNPSIYHRKELFLHHSHPLREQFARQTLEEERANLLARPGIGRRKNWERLCSEASSRL